MSHNRLLGLRLSINSSLLILNRKLISNLSKKFRHLHHVCIIGSGPAGFYAAQQIAKSLDESRIDIYEKLPVPFGLVRYGVAPDHPEVKNVINTFTTVLKNPKVRFIGNIEVGKDVSFTKLQESYNAILLCYGASEDRKLGIEGEDENIIPGREFVGWYNGLPENRNMSINLTTAKRAFIIGQGNVALDIARILLTPISQLAQTDIATYALSQLKTSSIEEVVIYGRRGPLQVAFTIKELRELINLENVRVVLDKEDFRDIDDKLISNLPRSRKRLIELLYKTSQKNISNSGATKTLSLKFLRSPLSVERDDKNRLRMKFGLNSLVPGTEKIESLGESEAESCDLIFRSVGYKGRRLFKEIPFDEEKGIIPNINGKVQQGVYCCGWLGQGPRGVILSTMQNAFDVGKLIAHDLQLVQNDGGENNGLKSGYESISRLLEGKKITGYGDYVKIAEHERRSGTKVTTVEEMIKISES